MLQGFRYFVFFVLVLTAQASELSDRIENYLPRKGSIFNPSRTEEFEKGFLTEGQRRFGSFLSVYPFKGYVADGDPYDRNKRRISFLLGADSAHLLHRIFQMLGAPYPWVQVRHWRWLAEKGSELTPEDLSPEKWSEFVRRFDVVVSQSAQWEAGDVLVFRKSSNSPEVDAQMGLVVSTHPIEILHAHPERGIVQELLSEFLEKRRVYAFRWRGELEYLKASPWSELLQVVWSNDPIRCEKILKPADSKIKK